MERRRVILLCVLSYLGVVSLRSQRDFLRSQEVDAIRDEQEPGKRIVLYLDFAGRRLEAVKAELASPKERAGKAAQENLKEYIAILEALETTLEEGRENRFPLEKALKQLQERASEFLKYLQSLQSESSPRSEDYRFTLEEAITMTQEVLAEAAKGAFPEVRERKSVPSRQ